MNKTETGLSIDTENMLMVPEVEGLGRLQLKMKSGNYGKNKGVAQSSLASQKKKELASLLILIVSPINFSYYSKLLHISHKIKHNSEFAPDLLLTC